MNKRHFHLLLIAVMLLNCLSGNAKNNIREHVNINREWKFLMGDHPGAETATYSDVSWTATNLPHSFSIPYFLWKDVYHGYGWYRKSLDLPSSWQGKRVEIEFEGVFIETEVWLNGHFVGRHSGGYTSFAFDLTPYVEYGEAAKNVLAVRVNNIWRPDVAPRAGDHQFSGGIYRDVWLNVSSNVFIPRHGVFIHTPEVSKKCASVAAEVEVNNDENSLSDMTVESRLLDAKGKSVAKTEASLTVAAKGHGRVELSFPSISNPALWSPEHPNLYTAITQVKRNGKVVDRRETRFGIHSMAWTADKGFYLNGEHYYLLGANVHQDQAGWGDAVTNGAIRRDVKLIKDAGFNCIRGSHYPHDPAFVEACDEMGIIFLMESAFWGMGGNTTEAPWGQGAPASCYPTQEKDQAPFEANVLCQLRECIMAFRNAPSIAAWSLCNEPFFCSPSVDDKMRGFLRLATDSARKWDPTRQVAIGGCQRKATDQLGQGQIAFYNGDGASRKEFQCPGVPSIVSEYGSTVQARPGTFAPGWGDVVDGMTNRPVWRSGHIIWCGFDHGTVGGKRLALMGIIDYFRLPKRAYYWYQQAYREGIVNPVEPKWPEQGTPAKLQLSASGKQIASDDGTDDVQIVVTVLDKEGKHISNNVKVNLQIVSGPGEFPTGRSITFTPPSSAEASDIEIRDGQAAIALHSYHSGKTVVRATADGLEPAEMTITTRGSHPWHESMAKDIAPRTYHRCSAPKKQSAEVFTIADNRPTWASSELDGTDKSNPNNSSSTAGWRSTTEDKAPWWKLFLEDTYDVSYIELSFPDGVQRRYAIETSADGEHWREVATDATTRHEGNRHFISGDLDKRVTWVRVMFATSDAALTHIRIGGMKTK